MESTFIADRAANKVEYPPATAQPKAKAKAKAKAKPKQAEAEEVDEAKDADEAEEGVSSSSTDDDDLPLSKLAQKARAEAEAEADAKEAKGTVEKEEDDGNAEEEEGKEEANEEEVGTEKEVKDAGTAEPKEEAAAPAAPVQDVTDTANKADAAAAAVGAAPGTASPKEPAGTEPAKEAVPMDEGNEEQVGGEEKDAAASSDPPSTPLEPAPPTNEAATANSPPPSADDDAPLPMDVDDKAAISPVAPNSDGTSADRKRSMQTEEYAASSSPGQKRQRLTPADDPSPPLPPGPPPEQEPSRVVTQDTTDTSRQRTSSPPAASSLTRSPTAADMAIDQPTPPKPPSPQDQDESDEIRKALEVDSSPQPLSSATLEETRPRSMSVSPPSDPSHSGLCSPVPEHEHQDEEAITEEEELESVEYTPAPCLDTMKMNIFLEGCKAHRGKGPERRFADYWDALARNIALGLRGKDRSKRCSNDEACNGIEYILSSFLTTKRLKRLHNELILAIMKQSLGTLVAEDKFKRHIPVAWRGRAQRKLGFPQKPSSTATKRVGDVETQTQEASAEETLQEDVALDIADSTRIRSMFAYESSVWSVCGQRDVSEKSKDATDISTANISNAKTSTLLRPVIPSAHLPGALIIDPLVRSLAAAENMSVSEDAIWLAIVAVREHATTTLRQALQNKSDLDQASTDMLDNNISGRTITSSDLALGSGDGPRSSRLSAEQGLISRSNSLQPCTEYASAEMNVTRAIHLAARRRLLTLGLPTGSSVDTSCKAQTVSDKKEQR